MFAKDGAPPLQTAATIDAKLSSASTISAAFFATSVSGDAHRDADVGSLQGRRIVHAISGHCHDRPCALQGFDDSQLVLWIEPAHRPTRPARCGRASRPTSSRARRPLLRSTLPAIPSSAAITAAVTG